jgi:cytochrome P450
MSVQKLRMKVQKIMEAKGSESSIPTVFDVWARPDEKRKFRPDLRQLTADAFTFHGAGTDTTAHTLTMGTWHLINNEDALHRLRNELHDAIADPDSKELISSSVLERLPYLVSNSRRIREIANDDCSVLW